MMAFVLSSSEQGGQINTGPIARRPKLNRNDQGLVKKIHFSCSIFKKCVQCGIICVKFKLNLCIRHTRRLYALTNMQQQKWKGGLENLQTWVAPQVFSRFIATWKPHHDNESQARGCPTRGCEQDLTLTRVKLHLLLSLLERKVNLTFSNNYVNFVYILDNGTD